DQHRSQARRVFRRGDHRRAGPRQLRARLRRQDGHRRHSQAARGGPRPRVDGSVQNRAADRAPRRWAAQGARIMKTHRTERRDSSDSGSASAFSALSALKSEGGATVREMFDRIAPRYDLANRVMSAGVDVWWRRRAVAALAPNGGEVLLDLACGTGDCSRAILRRAPGARVVGADFAREMLRRYPF